MKSPPAANPRAALQGVKGVASGSKLSENDDDVDEISKHWQTPVRLIKSDPANEGSSIVPWIHAYRMELGSSICCEDTQQYHDLISPTLNFIMHIALGLIMSLQSSVNQHE